ncbi:urease accessory protein UreF [Halobacillus shinanisalinarum]|uniref:Urease accessory protein UreF n=1 Tax=Halobacillus shinanisalinarum TaxID=2932258 RepID=A0ABY4H4B3_9BACI|nr:urease accessory protein UreF [Halobacillus shinanisalinarum]UOQ94745.1 urease accessory protein UreF [Halobacillus shinanisalinarum]
MSGQKEDSNNRLNTGGISTDQQLLHLFQIHDSAFPIGSYTQSFGMETYIQQNMIKTKQDLIEYCKSYLYYNLACGDGILIKESYKAAENEDFDKLAKLEQICNGMKLAKESRDGSIKMGKQFLQTVLPLSESKLVNEWKNKFDNKVIKGHYPVLYGIYTASLDVHVEQAVLTFLYASVNGLIQNAVRAVPLGQNNGVQAMYELLSPIEEASHIVENSTLDDLHNNALGIEMASMQHEYLFSRLFIS